MALDRSLGIPLTPDQDWAGRGRLMTAIHNQAFTNLSAQVSHIKKMVTAQVISLEGALTGHG